MTGAAAAAKASSIVNEQNPWPGLAPFDEASAAFFNGRERETAELFRLVAGSHLTLLFGASGLGKSSLLQAGLFPKLRSAHYLPVYLRLDVADTTRPLIEQVRAALIREGKTHGVDAPEFQEGESLWRYLHRDGLEFWSRQTHLLTPVFVFDQFEEILTYRDENPAGTAQFRIDIADLAENRIPAALDGSAVVGLTLDRRCYKIVLSFREDYTAAFESWKRDLPSIMRNRYPLTAMDATNALEAVLTTGAAVIERSVAQEIVRYVAGADDKTDEETLATLPVEPALLSVVCSELNRKRLAANPPAPRISSADFKASRDNILKDFYERSLADTPKQVRQFIEERLLTESGRRNTAPEDDVERAGVPLTVVEQLVDRRLLRREKRLGVTHLELTHDRLTTVVGLSRDARRIRSRRHRLLLVVFGCAVGLMTMFVWLAYRQVVSAKANAQRALASREHEYERLATIQAKKEQEKTADLNDKLTAALRQSDSDAALAKAALSAAQLRSNFRFGLTQVISSPSASVVLTIGEDGRLSVLRGKTASGMSYFIKDPDGPIIAAAISPSEKQIATATPSGRIAVWEALSGSRISSFEWSGQISSLSFYSDEAGKLIVASRDGTLRLFNIKTGKMEDSRNAVFASRGCIPFTAQFLAYNPRPLYRASVGFEAQCADGLRDAAPVAERELTPDQAAFLVGPAADSAKSVDATLGPKNSKPQVSDPPPVSTSSPPPVASPKTPQNARGQERWRMDFSVWTREKPTNEFKPLATAQVEFEGGPKSIDIVQRGLNEAQIRTVSRQIEQLADRLTASGATTKDPARQAGFTALVMATANAILKELGFPPLSSNR